MKKKGDQKHYKIKKTFEESIDFIFKKRDAKVQSKETYKKHNNSDKKK